MKSNPYFLLELANAHGGDVALIQKSIDFANTLDYSRIGVKFQVFSANTIALPDFSWFETYKTLEQSPETWKYLINYTKSKNLDVWIDLFDSFGVETLQQNLAQITGIKLQSSILNNYEVYSKLMSIDLSNVTLIINVSGVEIEAVRTTIIRFRKIRPQNLILQIGFQSYPTQLADSALNKIPILKELFPEIQLCLADHSPAEEEMSKIIPLLGIAAGCTYIEKHFVLSRTDAEFDKTSALEPEEMANLINLIKLTTNCFGNEYINDCEAEYLKKTLQIPITTRRIPARTLISAEDLIYRRTSQEGLDYSDISREQNSYCILDSEVAANSAIPPVFRPARIGVIVAGRMKSSRLERKAVIPIMGVPSISRCLGNCLKITAAHKVILATSTEPDDDELVNYTLDGRVEISRGDPTDVINRYLVAAERHGIDVIVRVTADCPVVSSEMADFLIKSHFESGADYTGPDQYAVGTNCEIYNVEALERIIRILGGADYSEYMTWYLRNNPEEFKLNIVALPPDMVRDYRLTLDYPEDLEMFKKLFRELTAADMEPTLENVYKILDAHPEIVNLNGHLTLKYRTDPELVETLDRVTKMPKR